MPLTIHQGLLGVHEQGGPQVMVLLQHHQGLETHEDQTWFIKPFELFRFLFLQYNLTLPKGLKEGNK